jgi:hypothetical protein
MSEQTTTTNNAHLSPRQTEALSIYRNWQEMPEAERPGYGAFVAEQMGVTTGRAGVYVREALAAIGEAPQNGRRSGGGRKPRVALTAEAQIQHSIDVFDQTVDRMRERITQAEEAAQAFDAEQYITERTEDLKAKVKAAQSALKAWQQDEAAQTAAADEAREALAQKVQQVRDEVENDLTAAQAQREALVTALDSIKA